MILEANALAVNRDPAFSHGLISSIMIEINDDFKETGLKKKHLNSDELRMEAKNLFSVQILYVLTFVYKIPAILN